MKLVKLKFSFPKNVAMIFNHFLSREIQNVICNNLISILCYIYFRIWKWFLQQKCRCLNIKEKNVFVHLHIWHYLTLTFCGYRYHTTFVVISCISYLIDVWFSLYNANEREEILLKPETIWIKDFLVIVFVDTIRPDNISIQASRKPSLSFLLSITLLQNIFSNLMPFHT